MMHKNEYIINSSAVTVKTLGLLPDQAWILFDFPDFKHDYIKEVYRSDLCFAFRSRGPVIFMVNASWHSTDRWLLEYSPCYDTDLDLNYWEMSMLKLKFVLVNKNFKHGFLLDAGLLQAN